MSIRIVEWQFDDHNVDELWRHGITDADVVALLDDERLMAIPNKKHRSGTYKVIGRGRGGRLITVVIVEISVRHDMATDYGLAKYRG